MEEEIDFTTSYFVNPRTFDKESIEKITTEIDMNKSIAKDKETGGGVGH